MNYVGGHSVVSQSADRRSSDASEAHQDPSRNLLFVRFSGVEGEDEVSGLVAGRVNDHGSSTDSQAREN